MKYWFWPALIIVSLFGLGAIQFYFLRIGLLLEQRKFNQQIEASLQRTVQELNTNKNWTPLYDDLFGTSSSIIQRENARISLIDSIDQFIRADLSKRQIRVDFSFALRPARGDTPFLQSLHYDEEYYAYERFGIPFFGEIGQRCFCESKFNLLVDDLFGYLLKKLFRLIIPTISFLVIILIGIAWLIMQMRRLKELDTIKNDFINNLTHELKTPAFSIGLITKMLQQFTKDRNREKAIEYLGMLESENNQIKTHVEKVLELASLESGQYRLNKEEVDVHLLLKDLEQACRVKVERENGDWKMNLDATKSKIHGDPIHLKNTFLNLIDNSLKYNGNRPVITVQTSSTDKYLNVVIMDNGIGILPKDQKRIFKKFFRVASGNLQKAKGFGLGLSYVYEIVKKHRGKINVDSEIGTGSSFTLSFPLPPTKDHLFTNKTSYEKRQSFITGG